MLRLIGVAVLLLVCTAANAKPRHDSETARGCVYGNTAVIVCPGPEYRTTAGPRVRALHLQETAPEQTDGRKYCHVLTAAGEITIACWLAPKMEGFIADVVARGFKGRVKCFSTSHSHVVGSLHFIAEACDFAQRGWGKTVRPMYHVADLAQKWHLRDGCKFRDCGHIDSGRTSIARDRRRLASND